MKYTKPVDRLTENIIADVQHKMKYRQVDPREKARRAMKKIATDTLTSTAKHGTDSLGGNIGKSGLEGRRLGMRKHANVMAKASGESRTDQNKKDATKSLEVEDIRQRMEDTKEKIKNKIQNIISRYSDPEERKRRIQKVMIEAGRK